MTPLAIGLVLASASMHAFRDFFTKKSEDKQVFLWLFVTTGLIVMSPVAAYILARDGMPNARTLGIMLLGSMVHCTYSFFLTKSLHHGDLSHVYPIIRSAPALVLVVSFVVFGERVSAMGVVGILLVVFGSYVINVKKERWTAVVEPLASIGRERATQFAFLTMLLVTAYSLADKRISTMTQPLLYIYFVDLVMALVFTPFVLLTKDPAVIRRALRTNKMHILLNGILGFVGYALILYAFRLSPLSLVAGLRQTSVVIAVLLGGHILKEQNRFIRLIGAILIALGAIGISLA